LLNLNLNLTQPASLATALLDGLFEHPVVIFSSYLIRGSQFLFCCAETVAFHPAGNYRTGADGWLLPDGAKGLTAF